MKKVHQTEQTTHWMEFENQKPAINDLCLFLFKKERHTGNWVGKYEGKKLFIENMETAKAKWLLLPPIPLL